MYCISCFFVISYNCHQVKKGGVTLGAKLRMYNILVNRNRSVKHRYERFISRHSGLHAKCPMLSWAYAVWLNIRFSLLHLPDRDVKFRQKAANESGTMLKYTADELAKRLCSADIVSFDVFDTLIHRPFASPADLFYVVGEKLGIPDFRRVRTECEREARKLQQSKGKGSEVTLEDIYTLVSKMTGISANQGAAIEAETELSLCFADSFMLSVWDKVIASGKTVIVTTDMYMPVSFFEQLLSKNGFNGYDRIFVSCENGCGKSDGALYKKIKESYGKNKYIHIGDNRHSDIRNAKKAGFAAVLYPNVNSFASDYRPHDMSYIIGSVYSGIVNTRLYCSEKCSPAYEYGYKCGGLLILGYCGFIYRTAKEKNIDKILFFSRDGYILKQIFDALYNDIATEYVYWSRSAATKLCADIFPFDYVRRFISYKVNRGLTLGEVFEAMELYCENFSLDPGELLTRSNEKQIAELLSDNINNIEKAYSDSFKAAEKYLGGIISDSKNILTVDCGWAGSGSIMLDALLHRRYGMDVGVTGVLACTNSKDQHDSDFSETFIADGKLIPYCFSSSLNRRSYENHRPSMKHNIYFELLFGAPEPSFRGFSPNGEMKFDTESENAELVMQIHNGEKDFIQDYLKAAQEAPMLMNISGSDAYAPFAAALSDKKYLSGVFKGAVFDETTAGGKTKI